MGVSMDDSVGPVPLPAASAIVRAHEVGDSAMVAELVEQAPLEAWFGIAPPHLREILDAVPPRLLATGSAARTFRIVLHGPVDERSVGSAPTADAPGGEIAALFFDARARGDAFSRGEDDHNLSIFCMKNCASNSQMQIPPSK